MYVFVSIISMIISRNIISSDIFTININRYFTHNNINHIILSKPLGVDVGCLEVRVDELPLFLGHDVVPGVLLGDEVGGLEGGSLAVQRLDSQSFGGLSDEGAVGLGEDQRQDGGAGQLRREAGGVFYCYGLTGRIAGNLGLDQR